MDKTSPFLTWLFRLPFLFPVVREPQKNNSPSSGYAPFDTQKHTPNKKQMFFVFLFLGVYRLDRYTKEERRGGRLFFDSTHGLKTSVRQVMSRFSCGPGIRLLSSSFFPRQFAELWMDPQLKGVAGQSGTFLGKV